MDVPYTLANEDDPLAELLATSKLVHEPSRLAILSYLAEADEETDFMKLARVTGLSRGNLTIQLDKLEKGGLIETTRVIRRRRTRRTARLTRRGLGASEDYWTAMETFRDRMRDWISAGTEPANTPFAEEDTS